MDDGWDGKGMEVLTSADGVFRRMWNHLFHLVVVSNVVLVEVELVAFLCPCTFQKKLMYDGYCQKRTSRTNPFWRVVDLY